MNELGSVPVNIVTSFGWVVLTPEVTGPFVIGPFVDEEEGRVWLSNIEKHLVEHLTVLGPTAMFHPDSYTDVSSKMRERGAVPGSLTITNDLRG